MLSLTLLNSQSFAQSNSRSIVKDRVINEHGNVRSIVFNEGQNPSTSQAKATLAQQLNVGENCSFQLIKTETDAIGMTHDKYQMFYKNIPVEFSHYIVHSKNGKIRSMNGENYNIINLNVQPSLSKESAFNNAKKKIGASNYLSGISSSDQAMGYTGPNTELVVFPTIPLINKAVRLAYKMDIYATDPLYRATVYIDAQTGELFFQNNKIHHTNVGGSGPSLYEGNVNFTADYTGTNYRLRQTSSGSGIQTYNLNNGTNYTSAADFTSSSTAFTNTKGNQAHYAAEQTHAYYLQKHNRNSFNNTGGIIKSYVSYSSNYVNAFWNGSVMTYGDGNGTTYGPLITLDIVGHEITHGVTEYSANLVYQKESGALNESFSDIFGEEVEYFGKGSNNWLMGSEIFLQGAGSIRSMSNPKQYSDPDCYGGTYWTNPNCSPSSSNDYCGVHSNSGVQNKWFYLLVVGGSGTNDLSNSYSVTGIGMDKSAAIAYRNLTVYLTSNSNFMDARNGAIQAATDLYGAGSPEVIATTNAWYAVGVGSAYGGTPPPPPPLICVGGNLQLVLKLDNYPTETSWKIFDSLNNIIAQGSGYTTAGATSTQNINLTPGTYTFTMYDSYGDGICCAYGTGYYHLISGSDTVKSGGSFGSSESKLFCVTGSVDNIAPSNPTNLVASNTTASSTNLSWTASTDNVGVTLYTIYQGSNAIGTSTTTTYNVTGLNMNSTYSFSVKAQDAAGNVSGASNSVSVTTNGDIIPPSNPTNLSASNTTMTTTNLSWTASTDNIGVALYLVYQGSNVIATTTSTTYAVTGLTMNSTYSFSVKAQDAAGNISGSSNVVSVTTLNDVVAPTSPTNLVATNTTTTSTNLNWTASTDNVGVTLYTIYESGNLIGSSTSTNFAVTSLTPSTSYSFSVKAQDAVGNISGSSNVVSVTTLSNTSSATILHQGYFETGWDGWSDGGADCSRYSGSRSSEGNFSIIIQDNSGVASSMTSPVLNLIGYDNVKVQFSFYAVSMENNEDFWLQYMNGNTATTLATYKRGTNFNNNTFYTASVVIPSSAVNFISNAKFRFRCDASDNSDKVYIDKVIITGYVGAVPSFNGIVELGGAQEEIETELSDISENLIVYPNPASDNISLAGITEMIDYQIFDMSGKLIQKGNFDSNTISIQNLSNGMYIIKVNSTSKTFVERFMKQ